MKHALHLAIAAFLVLPVAPAFAQEVEALPELGGRGDDGAREMIELFHRVERNLERIDDQLADAGAGELPLEGVGSSGLEDLLRESQRQSREVESAIERILELAQQMGQGQGQGTPPPGESPLDQPRDQSPGERERTPGPPEQPEGGEEPHPGEEGQDPKDGPNPKDGENRPGDPPQEDPGDPRSGGRDADQWGFLPDRYREVFRNQGRDELPVRYRNWIDTYYRRLNRTDR